LAQREGFIINENTDFDKLFESPLSKIVAEVIMGY
jgi:hypothetical protein